MWFEKVKLLQTVVKTTLMYLLGGNDYFKVVRKCQTILNLRKSHTECNYLLYIIISKWFEIFELL